MRSNSPLSVRLLRKLKAESVFVLAAKRILRIFGVRPGLTSRIDDRATMEPIKHVGFDSIDLYRVVRKMRPFMVDPKMTKLELNTIGHHQTSRLQQGAATTEL